MTGKIADPYCKFFPRCTTFESGSCVNIQEGGGAWVLNFHLYNFSFHDDAH
jgi:hypothetical protein